ncbi:adenylate/guanylate cyclase domain-containing protein [Bradyrhizobium sp. URHC0002]
MVQERPVPVGRRLAAIVAADVAGYSRLMHNDEEATHANLSALLADVVEPAISEHGGRIVKNTGDGLLAEFPSAVEAVRAAVQFQNRINELAAADAEDKRIAFRVGINVGDVIVEPHDIFGDGVNIAARLEGIAEPGGICLSSTAYDYIRGKVGIEFVDLGEQHLKNIARPVRVYAATPVAAGHPTPAEAGNLPDPYSKPLPLPDKPSIAVLPFENMSGDPEQEYFADGIVEEIITALSHFKSLFVIARNSTFTYKGKPVDIRQAGRELGVRYILEGSVRKGGGRVRITGQLIDAATGNHLWADKFDGSLSDVFDLQDEVTEKVVSFIAPALEVAEIERAKRKPTEQLDSYDLFLKGMALFYQRRTASTIEDAYNTFKKAAEVDSRYASAHVMAGFSSMMYQAHTGIKLSAARLEEAVRSAETAASLDEDDAFVQARAGHVLTYFGHKYDLGLSLVDRAVKLNSNLAPAWYSRGAVSVMCEKPQEAIRSFRQMKRLSPRDPLLVRAWYMTGWAHFMTQEYMEGCAAAEKAMQRVPDAHSLSSFAANAIRAGRLTEAQDAAERLLRFQPGFRASHCHYLFPVRSLESRNRIQAALQDAGIPE